MSHLYQKLFMCLQLLLSNAKENVVLALLDTHYIVKRSLAKYYRVYVLTIVHVRRDPKFMEIKARSNDGTLMICVKEYTCASCETKH